MGSIFCFMVPHTWNIARKIIGEGNASYLTGTYEFVEDEYKFRLQLFNRSQMTRGVLFWQLVSD